jgi:uncharacterized protein (TIGR02186 family)
MIRTFAAFAFLALATPAAADQLAAGLSTDAIRITSSFRGADLVIFGAVASDTRLGDLTQRDIVVVLRAPPASTIVRRKERIAGLWINAHVARVDGMPAFYYVAGTRPFDQIAPDETLKALEIGASQLPATVATNVTIAEAAAAHAAVVRARTRARLYGEKAGGVERLGKNLFRVRVRLPATVPPGSYRADVFLFEKDTLVARATTALPIAKAGLERRLADWAEHQPLPYALAAVALALVLGWAGFAAFRRGQ